MAPFLPWEQLLCPGRLSPGVDHLLSGVGKSETDMDVCFFASTSNLLLMSSDTLQGLRLGISHSELPTNSVRELGVSTGPMFFLM